MFSHSVVLGSAAIVAFASGLEHLVDDADIKVHGATVEPLSQCPATASRTFHHDGLQKDRHAEATYHFDPPRDGCYLIEQRTELDAIRWTSTNWSRSQNEKCKASSNTKVHVHYGKVLQAFGTVDQTPKGFGRQPEDRWTFIAALQFHAGHPGNVTLSNEGTEPGTLTVFDQVRFSWSGKDCVETRAHPRRAEIRLTVDFEHVADRLTIFGIALKKRLAEMAGIPEDSMRLTGLRPGSVIAEFLILPSVVDDLHVGSASDSIELLRKAIYQNWAELCALSGASLEGCNIELKDLGFAMPSVEAVKALPEPEQRLQQQQEDGKHADGTADVNNVVIVVCAVAASGLLLFFVLYRLYGARSNKTEILSPTSSVQSYTNRVQPVEASMEEGHSVKEKEQVEQGDDKSTVCPSEKDEQSEPSHCGDCESSSTPEQGMTEV
jgi:hypothetical protein